MTKLHAILFAAVIALSGCGKKKEEAAAGGSADQAAKPAETATGSAKADTAAAPADPAKAAAPAGGGGSLSVDEAGAKALAFMDKLVAASKGADCAAIGASLKALIPEAKSFGEMGREFDKDEAKKKEFDAKFEGQLEERTKGAFEAIGKCQDNADVQAFAAALSEAAGEGK